MVETPYHLLFCRWALGVLIYFMLLGEMPFGSWRDGELDTYAKIAKGHLNLPETLSLSVIDLITKVNNITINTSKIQFTKICIPLRKR